MEYVILITGARDWNDYDAIYNELNIFNSNNVTVIHGNCRGADLIADAAAKSLKFKTLGVSADWKTYGRAAGPIRNKQMVNELVSYRERGFKTLVLAFHDNLEQSKGTKHCVNEAKKAGLDIELIFHS